MKPAYAIALLLLIAGCASYSGQGLVPGQSTAKDVEALMGSPRERITSANGDTIWYYPHQPFGRQMYAVRIAPQGVVRSVEQTLTEENVRKVVPGSTTSAQAREIFGPPFRVAENTRMLRHMWEYTMWDKIQMEFYLYLQFSPDGVLREAMMLKDYNKEVGHGSFP